MTKLTFWLLIIVVGLLSNVGFGAIPSSERAALIALYNSVNGDAWTQKAGWKTPPLDADGFAMPGMEGNWYGVTLSGDHVIKIELNDNHLIGIIPPELGNLNYLEALFLFRNQLSGAIPSQLGNLGYLQYLYLGYNQLSGSIPSQLGNPMYLNRLYLSNNQLSGGIPSELCNLSNLQILDLENNQLSGAIPTELGNLSNLYWLYLDNNQLSGAILPQLGNLSNLYLLYLDNNQLSGAIPPELGHLSKLKWLYLDNNHLSGGIPSELGNLNNLDTLALNDNQLSGAIPSELGNLSNLQWLFLDNNQLSGVIPSQLGNLSNLSWLYLDHNQLSGVIPSSFVNIAKISPPYLDIGYNCLSATDPALITWLNNRDRDWEITQCLEKAAPFGEFSTPIDGSVVSSSIAITGWALDDYGIESVKIYRKQENILIFIGDAIFIEGARPDVEIAYPGYPDNNKAGWGYMLLTQFLPNGGNGTYTLIAKATDIEGNEITLGAKTITIDNVHAVKPFGAIDTPTQGGAASGKEFVNFGWALTPQPNTIPIDGSTINVIIDGVVKGHPGYNVYRSDIEELLPGYANTNGAGGYCYLDTTKLTNGLHTIAWTVADNAGNSDGIGSRYFSVTNTRGIESPVVKDIGNLFSASEIKDDSAINQFEIKELERLEINLSDIVFFNPTLKTQHPKLEGYMVVGDRLRELPIGSTLDKESGVFYWQPGPGFVGEYRLLFIGKDNEGSIIKKNIIINIKPR